MLTRTEHLVESKEGSVNDKRNDDGGGGVNNGDDSDNSVLCLF
jgi:hypothetical protein